MEAGQKAVVGKRHQDTRDGSHTVGNNISVRRGRPFDNRKRKRGKNAAYRSLFFRPAPFFGQTTIARSSGWRSSRACFASFSFSSASRKAILRPTETVRKPTSDPFQNSTFFQIPPFARSSCSGRSLPWRASRTPSSCCERPMRASAPPPFPFSSWE